MTGDPPASTAATVTSSSSDTEYDPYLGGMEERRMLQVASMETAGLDPARVSQW